MEKKTDQRESSSPEQQENRRGNNSLFIAILVAALVVLLFYNRGEERSLITASFFQAELDKGNIEEVGISERRVYGKFVTRPEIPESEKPESTELSRNSKATDNEPTQYDEKFVLGLRAIRIS